MKKGRLKRRRIRANMSNRTQAELDVHQIMVEQGVNSKRAWAIYNIGKEFSAIGGEVQHA